MTTDAIVQHAVIRDANGNLRCMDPGCGFNQRRPSVNSSHWKYHRATDLGAGAAAVRADGPDRRLIADSR